MTEVLTLYTARGCPYAHRVELALAESGIPHEKYQIDLQNKPEWYAPKINPASKVPAVAYGGPRVPADQPSPESDKIAESLVLLEFVADLKPDSHLLPKDPVKRAKARFFIEVVSTKFIPGYFSVFLRGETDIDGLLAATETVQDLLNPEGFAVGAEPTIADFALLPFVARGEILAGIVPSAAPAFKAFQEPKFAKFWKWYTTLRARPSFQDTFDEALITEAYRKHFAAKK